MKTLGSTLMSQALSSTAGFGMRIEPTVKMSYILILTELLPEKPTLKDTPNLMDPYSGLSSGKKWIQEMNTTGC